MNARTKSILIVAGTLLLGCVLGAFTTGAVIDRRMERLHAFRTHEGFAAVMEEAIGIRDPAQREQVRPVLERALNRTHTLWAAFRAQRAAVMDSMQAELAPILDPEQQRNLEAWLEARDHRPAGHPKEK